MEEADNVVDVVIEEVTRARPEDAPEEDVESNGTTLADLCRGDLVLDCSLVGVFFAEEGTDKKCARELGKGKNPTTNEPRPDAVVFGAPEDEFTGGEHRDVEEGASEVDENRVVDMNVTVAQEGKPR